MAVQDSTGLRDTQTVGGSGVDLQTLRALQISTSGIDFGTHIPGTDTGSTNATTTILNTGNSPIDVQVSGNPLSNGVNTIAVGQQEYATSTFTYASCSLCQLLTGPAAPKSVGVSIPQPTSTTSPSTKNIYFGLGIPTGTSGSYSGSNTFTAVAPGG